MSFLGYQTEDGTTLYFLDDFWPDITRAHFDNILVEFKNVQRNFGT